MRAVITGGAGFLGSHLCDLIEKGWDVLCLDNLITGSESNIAHLIRAPSVFALFIMTSPASSKLPVRLTPCCISLRPQARRIT